MKVKSPRQLGLMTAFAGGVVFLLINILLQHSLPQKSQSHKKTVDFNLKSVKQKKTLALEKKPPPKIEKKERKSLKPKLNLDFSQPGMDLGLNLSDFQTQDSSLLSHAKEATLTEDMVDEPPRVRYREPLDFPEQARAQKLNGYVTLRLLISDLGRVKEIKLVESQPQGVFETVALQSVQAWEFEPGQLKGKPVHVWIKQKITFAMN